MTKLRNWRNSMAEHNDFMLKSKTEGIRLDYAHSCRVLNTGNEAGSQLAYVDLVSY